MHFFYIVLFYYREGEKSNTPAVSVAIIVPESIYAIGNKPSAYPCD